MFDSNIHSDLFIYHQRPTCRTEFTQSHISFTVGFNGLVLTRRWYKCNYSVMYFYYAYIFITQLVYTFQTATVHLNELHGPDQAPKPQV